jgi:hypothetical protein
MLKSWGYAVGLLAACVVVAQACAEGTVDKRDDGSGGDAGDGTTSTSGGGGSGAQGGSAGGSGGCTLDEQCPPDQFCDAGGECQPKILIGHPCTNDTDCDSGYCADGVCCTTACDGACESCLAMENGNSDGVCLPVIPGTECGPPSCMGGVAHGPSTCSGGSCIPGATTPCDPYVCDPNAPQCSTTCVTDADCAAPNECDAGVCTPPCMPPTPTKCNGMCVDTASDEQHCGGCNMPCMMGESCVGSMCQNGIIATYGNAVEFLDASSHGQDYLLGSLVNIPQSATLTHLSLISKSNVAQVKLALYTSVGGNPGNLVASTPATQLSVGTMEIPVNATMLPAGDYWIMGVYNVNASIGIDYSDPNAQVDYIPLPFNAALPTTFPAPIVYTGQKFNYYVKVIQ